MAAQWHNPAHWHNSAHWPEQTLKGTGMKGKGFFPAYSKGAQQGPAWSNPWNAQTAGGTSSGQEVWYGHEGQAVPGHHLWAGNGKGLIIADSKGAQQDQAWSKGVKGKGLIIADGKGAQQDQALNQPDGAGKGQGRVFGQSDVSDIDKFLTAVYQAVGKQCPLDMPTDALQHFKDICHQVDNWEHAATDAPRTQQQGIDLHVFNALEPTCRDTNQFGSVAWATQLAALLRLFYGPAAYAMRQLYMRQYVDIETPSRKAVKVRTSGLPPGLTLFIFRHFLNQLGQPIPVAEAVQVTQAGNIYDKVSYVLTLADNGEQDPHYPHQNLVSLIYAFHLKIVDWPGAAETLYCTPELLHNKIPPLLRPGLQAELYVAAIGIEKLTIEGLIHLHASDSNDQHYTFCNGVGKLEPHAWSREYSAGAIWYDLQDSKVFGLLPDEHSETATEPTARWWTNTLNAWERRGKGKERHPREVEEQALGWADPRVAIPEPEEP